jgi:Peptidase C39 family
MEKSMTRTPWLLVVAPAILIVIATSRTIPALADNFPERNPSAEAYDCGTLALYTLLQLEHVPIELSDIEAQLPPPSPSGYSMEELREGGRRCGLTLIGARMFESHRQPDRPLLAFLERGPHHHFTVVRPVGHTGSLVQVLDLDREPEILDAAKLYASSDWTGLVLIPDRSHGLLRNSLAIAAVLSLGLSLAYNAIRLHRGSVEISRRGGGSSPPG